MCFSLSHFVANLKNGVPTAQCPALILRDESCTGVAEYFFDNFVAYILYYGAIFAVFDKVAAQPAFES